jgi:hypothetical protein
MEVKLHRMERQTVCIRMVFAILRQTLLPEFRCQGWNGKPSENIEGRFWKGLGPAAGGVPNPPPRPTDVPGGVPRSQIPDKSGPWS